MKENALYDRLTTTFREVDIDKLDEPTQDLRFFRDSAFAGFLLNDLRREGAVVPVIVRPKPNTDRFVIVACMHARLLDCERRQTCVRIHR